MRAMTAVLLFGMLGGCAMTVPELRERGTHQQLTSAATPPQVASCAARRAPDIAPGLLAQVRESTPEAADVVLYYGNQLAANFTIARTGSGSAVDAYLWPHLLGFEQNRALAIFKGC